MIKELEQHPEQEDGTKDERAAFETWCAVEMGVPAEDIIGATGDDLWACWKAARAALAQPSPAPELKRREYPSRATYPDAGDYALECAEITGWNAAASQHERIVAGLRAERDAIAAQLAELDELKAEADQFRELAAANGRALGEALRELEALRSKVVVVPDERAVFEEFFHSKEAAEAGGNRGWEGIGWAAWQSRALLDVGGKTVSEGLLRKCCSEDQTLRNTACRTLRALLDEGKE